MSQFMQDIQYALRQLRKAPGFTITVILTMALGIGANAAIFTLVNAVLLKNLPVTDPKMLLWLGDTADCCVNSGALNDGDYSLFSTETYQQLRKSAPEFEELAAMQAGFRPIIVRRDAKETAARSVMGEFVSGNYFRTFGLQAQAGRLLRSEDDSVSAPVVAVMSYEAWQRDYAGDPAVVGSTFWVNTRAVTIAGIAPEGFYGDRLWSSPPDFYLPIETMPALTNAPYVHTPNSRWLYIIGRVKPGVQLIPLQEKLSALLRQSLATTRSFSTEYDKPLLSKAHVVLTSGGAGIKVMQEGYSSNLHLLMIISGLVLLIACANIANLLLVRGMSRKAEMSVRTALGAQRGRIIRQLLTESVLLAGLSGIVGLFVAYAGTRMLLMLAFPGEHSVPIHASPSMAVLGFACGLSLLTGILFGVAPAWIAAQAEPADALRSGARTTLTRAPLLQRGLVVLQASLSLVLLVGAGLFSQSLNKLQHQDFRLETKNRYIVHINPQAAGYTAPQLEALYRTMEDQFHALPGIKKVGISTYTPQENNNWSNSIQVQGQADQHDSASLVKGNSEYFDSVGTHVMMGRGIGMQDTSDAPPIAIVNQTFVKKFFKDANPLGQHFGASGPESTGDFEVVGVVQDTFYQSPRRPVNPMYFVPIMQRAKHSRQPAEKDESLYAGAIVLETERPMSNMESLTRRTLTSINPNLTVVKFETFNDQIAARFTNERMIARLMTLFGGLALLLASVGLYGVTAYGVARRTSEIGIRMALGAERANVVWMVMRGAMAQAGLGLTIGIPMALLCAQFVKSQLYGVAGTDVAVMAGAVCALSVSACVAGLIPAQRAASTDPVKALRTE